MTEADQQELGRTLWAIANDLRGAMNADDFRDYMLSFLFLRYLSDNYEAAVKKELGTDYPQRATEKEQRKEDSERRPPLLIWYDDNQADVENFEDQMRRKVHYVVKPPTSTMIFWQSLAYRICPHVAGIEAAQTASRTRRRSAGTALF